MGNMITEDYVSFETAKLLKEKGFDDGYTNAFYDKAKNLYFVDLLSDLSEHPDNDTDIAASTLYVAMKWLREVHNISVETLVDFGSGDEYWWTADVGYIKKDGLIDELCGYNSYEEACEAVIKYCLENLI